MLRIVAIAFQARFFTRDNRTGGSPTTHPTLTAQSRNGDSETLILLTSSLADSHVKTSASQDAERGSPVSDQFSLLSSSELQNLSSRDGSSWRMYPDSCQATADATSPDSSMKWSGAGMAWHGGFLMPDTSEFRSVVGESSLLPVEPTLSMILEVQADSRYELSSRAAAGILRRAGRRGRKLPEALEQALEAVAAAGK
jgi:hypothetical protein